MSIIAIVPARGGSKRIPKKNIKKFCGVPIIAYPLKIAQASKLFDETMVSTDDTEIAVLAAEYGASVPFMRSKGAATDFASTAEVIMEVITWYSRAGKTFDVICCIYPTAALITEDDLLMAYASMNAKNYDAVMPVLRYSHPPQRGFTITSDGELVPLHPKYISARTQDLKPVYHDAGQFYFVKTQTFFNDRTLTPSKTLPFFIRHSHAQDIDSFEDWNLAELKYRKRTLIE